MSWIWGIIIGIASLIGLLVFQYFIEKWAKGDY
jgi:hypothetical protein